MRYPHLILNLLGIGLILSLVSCTGLETKVQSAKEKACEDIPKAAIAASLTRQALELLPDGTDTEKAKAAADMAESTLKYLQAICNVE